MAVGYQTFYTAQLTSAISDTELTIPLDIVPTPDEGFLVLESTIINKREVIYYTSKTINSVVCPSGGRGYDGTTAVSHLQGATVIMAPVGAMFEELRQQFTTTPQGWTTMAQAVNTVTHNGNRSYDVAFASSITSTLSEGMRLQFTKTVAGNGYMGGAFNGSSHYFTKTTPSGTLGTVTNNFTIEAVVQPTSYQNGTIAARADAAGNNAITLKINASGRVECAVQNGGAANYRIVATYQSLPLNKKTHVAASWTGGTVVTYFDGVSVPVGAATTGGTAPTTAGTGGDFSIGRKGAGSAEYFPGYISNVAVFDAVLSAATIRQHATIKLLGNEPNCIGAWSLDNTANDQSSAGNNLTATGGVGFTAMTPHGQLGNGVETTKSVGLVMNVSGSTATVQVPEGCTIPTTGGITSVAYSTQANPYGWVSDKGRWEVQNMTQAHLAQDPVAGTVYNLDSIKLAIPIGSWLACYKGSIYTVRNAGSTATSLTSISTSASSFTDPDFNFYHRMTSGGAGTQELQSQVYTNGYLNLGSITDYYLVASNDDTATTQLTWNGRVRITAIPSGL